MKRPAVIATVVVLAHLAVSIVHGEAHDRLGVGLEPWQNAFVYLVIVAAPIVAVVMYWVGFPRPGALLLGVSLLAAMLFGLYFHFIAVSNDHVRHLPEGDARGLFVATAILLLPVDSIGAAFGFWNWRQLRHPKMS